MQKIIGIKDITKLYEKIRINSNGSISLDNTTIKIYEIENIAILKENIEYISKIYNLFYLCLKGIASSFQIVSLKEALDVSEEVEEIKRRMSRIKNINLKQAMQSYINNLDILMDNSRSQILRHYVVFPLKEEAILAFKPLEDIGLYLKEVKDNKKIEKILKKSMVKECT